MPLYQIDWVINKHIHINARAQVSLLSQKALNAGVSLNARANPADLWVRAKRIQSIKMIYAIVNANCGQNICGGA